MAGRGGTAYFVDDVWRARVRAELERRGWNASQFAAEIGISKSTLSEVLSGHHDTIKDLPRIHIALGFPPPRGPLATAQEEAVQRALSRMPSESAEALLALLRTKLSK